MDPVQSWNSVIDWIQSGRTLSLPRGKEFKVTYNQQNRIIEIVPTQTGIPRWVGEKEWALFINKFNEVIDKGYDPWKPGHYARISYNSSYLVAILKGKEILQNGEI